MYFSKNSLNRETKDEIEVSPLEVKVYNGNIEEALRRFKQLVQADGILNQYKDRMSFENPSEKKRRKKREAVERRLQEESRNLQIASGEWEKKQKIKEQKKQARIEKRKNQIAAEPKSE